MPTGIDLQAQCSELEARVYVRIWSSSHVLCFIVIYVDDLVYVLGYLALSCLKLHVVKVRLAHPR